MITGAEVTFNADGTVDITGLSSFPATEPFVMLIAADKNTAIIHTVNGVQNVTREFPNTSTTTTTNFETTTDATTTLFPISIFNEILGGWTAADGSTYAIVDAEDGSLNIFGLDASGKF